MTQKELPGLLCYDLEIPRSQHKLHVVSDPCSHHFEYSIGSGLWQASVELLDFLSGVISSKSLF
jgi:hypothetical protein